MKISPSGALQGDRVFRFTVLSFPQRGDTLFALARDAARTLEYRDASYFLRANKKLRTVLLDEEERDYLVRLGLIKPHLRKRPVAAVYAKEMFQTFGARVIVGTFPFQFCVWGED